MGPGCRQANDGTERCRGVRLLLHEITAEPRISNHSTSFGNKHVLPVSIICFCLLALLFHFLARLDFSTAPKSSEATPGTRLFDDANVVGVSA